MRILLTGLMSIVIITPQASAWAGGIAALQQDGRTVYTNDEVSSPAGAKTAAPAPRSAPRLVYWSRSEKRWKPVKPATRWAMRAAQSAAVEVEQYVANLPKAENSQQVSAGMAPEARTLVRGRKVTGAEIDQVIEQAAARHKVDANLVRAIIKVESNFNPRAVSHKGAMGLMQLMPGTARELGVANPFDAQQNVEAGVRHFKGLLQQFSGDQRLALAAYNAGAGAVQRNKGVPPYRETRNYVKKITELAGYTSVVGGDYVNPIRMSRDAGGKVVFTNVE